MRKIITAVFSLLIMVGLATPLYAKDEVTVVNNTQMGAVSIALETTYIDPISKKEVPWVQDRVVLPGDNVSEIVTIINEGEPAWIRAKAEFDSSAEVNLSEKEVVFKDGWIKKGDYWYWPKEVKTGEKVQWIDSINIPAEWESNQVKKTKMNVKVNADAVQTRHFTPNFDSNDPWFGTIIETSIYNHSIDKKSGNTSFSISYEGGAEGMVKVRDNFFQNWATLMPGDHLEDSAVIRNNYKQPIKMYFRSENQQVTRLEENVKLKIYRGEEKIYDGTLAGTQKEMLLAEMDSNSEFIFHFEIDVPAELRNEFDLTTAEVKWIFRAEILPSYSKRTGNETSFTPYLIEAGASIGVILLALLVLKKNKKDEKAA